MVNGSFVMGWPTGRPRCTRSPWPGRCCGYEPSDDLWPSEHLPKKLAAARARYAAYLENE
jgi:acyl-CoA dehydrogenase